MKKVLLILQFIYPLLTGFITDDTSAGRMEASYGFIDINVESNINKLFFKYDLKEKSYPFSGIDCTKNTDDTSAIQIVVPVKDFQCTNHFAYRDFLKLLKESQFPFLAISIPKNTIINSETGDWLIIHDVMLTIAGVAKKYDIICRIEYDKNREKVLIGTTKILLTDLDIEPPVKTLGLIRIKNEIIVNFGFYCNENLTLFKQN
ncbi:MAG TPA: hypothetical protein VMV77_11190 [Bacteroidales bacterium]|nr:hypothetical protein [Bacteroidales bacterium]